MKKLLSRSAQVFALISGLVSVAYAQQTATPTFSVAPGTYSTAQTLTISDSDAGAKIYYTANGSVPSTTSPRYTSPILVRQSETIRAIAIASGHTASSVALATYSFVAATPVISPASGTYPPGQIITITSSTPSAIIFYLTNGSFPTTSSPKYTGPFPLTSKMRVCAVAAETGFTTSAEVCQTYMAVTATATPVLSLASGTYTSTRHVTITDSTPGAAFFYATDGSTPTASSTPYTGPVPVTHSEVFKAIAQAPGFAVSQTATGAYVLRYIYTVAGTGANVPSGDGGPALQAAFSAPQDLAFDAQGNAYISDTQGACIRKVTADQGIISTIAGTCQTQGGGYSGDGGPAIDALLFDPQAIAFDHDQNIYFAESENNIIRKIDAASGIISTFAGKQYLFDQTTNPGRYSGDGGLATDAYFFSPEGLAFDSHGDLYIADTRNQVVRKITISTGIITTVAGMNSTSGGGPGGYGGDGGLATAASLNFPIGLAIDSHDNLYIGDYFNSLVRKVDAVSQVISIYAGTRNYTGPANTVGDKGLATNALVQGPRSLAFDSSNNLFITDYGFFRVREVYASTGLIDTVAGNGSGNGQMLDGQSSTASTIGFPIGIATDSVGDLYLLTNYTPKVRKVSLHPTPALTFGVTLPQ